MTFQLLTDKKPFQFHLIHIGMNPLTGDASTRSKEDLASISTSISMWIAAARKHSNVSRFRRCPQPELRAEQFARKTSGCLDSRWDESPLGRRTPWIV
jgi:hypothetical protein